MIWILFASSKSSAKSSCEGNKCSHLFNGDHHATNHSVFVMRDCCCLASACLFLLFFFQRPNARIKRKNEQEKKKKKRYISNNSDGWKKQSRPFYPITPFCSCTSRSRPPPHTLCWLSSSSFYYDVYYDSKEGKERERVFVCKVLLPHNPFVFCFRASFYIHFQLSSFYSLSLFLPMSI